MSRSNNVRGPTSALTEFLRESGITATTISRRVQTQAGPSRLRQEVSTADGENEIENEREEEQEQPVTATRTPRRRTRASVASPAGYASDELDEPEGEAPVSKKRKLSKAAQEKVKAKEKEKQKKAKAKKGNGDIDDGDGEDEDEDAYTALSKSMWTNKATSSSKPPVGSFDNCAKCEKQFTVTKYTMAANPGPGFLCHQCAKASGADPFKKPTSPRKRKAPAEKRIVVNFEERRFPSLASLCIQIITRYINDVEALGNIGAINMDQIAKALAHNRSLTAENAQLFYDVQNTKLTLYDATKIPSAGFCTLASLNPNLTSLRLDYCGRLDDSAFSSWCTALPALRRIELLGPFLVRTPAWTAFFEAHPHLESFLITQSPRFDIDCAHALAQHCSGLQELRLKEVGLMSDGFLEHFGTLNSLCMLDLADPTHSCSEDALVQLMRATGPSLTHLDLSGHTSLTDAFLTMGIAPHVHSLTTLTLSNVPELTDEGVAAFFDAWAKAKTNPPLSSLDFSRNGELSSDALTALLKHSGAALTQLNINAWKTASAEALGAIPRRAKELTWLDVGWCREVDDFFMKALMENCGKIEQVRCWGCNRLTENCPRKRGVNIYGVEAQKLL